jgi:thiol-disulfide isomerase/thioredoxin
MRHAPPFLAALLVPGLTLLAGSFDPAKDIRISWTEGAVVLAAPAGIHLKGRFLSVALAGGPGTVTMGPLPPASGRDEAGDPIYRGEVRIPVTGRGLAGEAILEVRYQACEEGPHGVCYLPMTRRLTVGHAGAAAAPEAPTAVVEDLGGRPYALTSLRGQVAVVDFWASWCGPCRKSFPALDRLHRQWGPKGLRVVGVSLDEDRDALGRFLDSVPVGFQIAWDRFGVLAREFQVVSMPTTLLFDREGRVVARFEGGGRMEEEERAVVALLEGRELPPGTGATVAPGLRATGDLKAWNRGHLADPIMTLDGDPLSRALWEHIHSSKEGAAGNGGAAGGGCGCN